MKNICLCIAITVFFCASIALAENISIQQTATLTVPRDKTARHSDEDRRCFSFEQGIAKSSRERDWDLGYGLLLINGEEWFQVPAGNDKRSVIKDIGELNWSDSLSLPALRPLPELKDGEVRNITVDSSADTHKNWKETNGIFAKAQVGHMYLVRIKDEDSDFYALFRVESKGEYDCAITWKLIPSPEK